MPQTKYVRENAVAAQPESMPADVRASFAIAFHNTESIALLNAVVTEAIQAAMLAEREACARIVDGICDPDGVRWSEEQRRFMRYELDHIVRMIRSRRENAEP